MRQCHHLQLRLMILLVCVVCNRADIFVFSATARHQIEEVFRDMPARFGGMIQSEGIKGMVVYADPPTACHEMQGPPNITNYNGNWVALIARCNCTFEIKVRMAQKAGYDAAIIHNVNSNKLEPIIAEHPVGILIPCVFVSEITGQIIKEKYLYDKLYFVLINDDTPYNIKHLLLPFAIVVGLCFLVMVIFMIVRCIKDRRRQRRHMLPNSSLKTIPTHKYIKGDPYETCAICLDDYIESEKLRILPCAHAYHTKCIDPWLTKNRRVCPVCKRKVFAAEEQIVTDESDSDTVETPLIRDGHEGTQDGTLMEQRENSIRHVIRLGSTQFVDNSGSSSGSEESLLICFDEDNMGAEEPPNGTAFVVSDTHTINEIHQLKGVLKSFPRNMMFCFINGSAVFKQLNNQSNNMLDPIFVVCNANQWCSENSDLNPKHYAQPLKFHGHRTVINMQENWGFKMYYNTLIKVAEEYIFNGVIPEFSRIEDSDWNDLYLTGRLHKPMKVLMEPSEQSQLPTALIQNLHSTVHAAFLLFPQHFTETEFYKTITGLSCNGDFQMIFSENKDKVNNIFLTQLTQFKQLYSMIMQNFENFCDISKLDQINVMCHQDTSLVSKMHCFNQFPTTPQIKLIGAWSQGARLKDTEECQHAYEYDPEGGVIREECLKQIVWRSNITQSLKGIVTAGLVKSVKYSGSKIMKMLQTSPQTNSFSKSELDYSQIERIVESVKNEAQPKETNKCIDKLLNHDNNKFGFRESGHSGLFCFEATCKNNVHSEV
ncbi:uncharacterized protein LOC143150762 isoform X2 [Ptiloglossa arizonensis]|uniref:uncharacterized protein LOC143150762 isoform X2 n=1 Tax=Ptiloglossa arizonensis TaxID=3350558 RepID=UPI003FA053A8